ncbi:MAG: SDR family oxidoreductase [Flavobacteriia bacterium]|jgi:short-subunit dehydrogenase|nr:MAG: SDR family oxidoreductase [Flavobacteriia bacterium]
MNKSVVILGASQGIGAALVDHFAQMADTTVIALSRNLDKMSGRFLQKNVRCYRLDIAGEVQNQLAQINLEGPIDILINNAGLLINKPFEQLSHQDLTESYQVNVIGIMEATQALLPQLATDAHIVNISSMGGFQGSLKFAGLAAYSTSKAALCAFTELFAEEYKATSLRMNCLCLGAVQTEMLSAAFPGYIAPTSPAEMAQFIANFALHNGAFFNGKIIPVSSSNP